VDNLTFGVKRGEIFGLLGANGSGKSTTTSCMVGILSPTSGKVTVLGQKASKASRKHVGYCTQKDNLFSNLTVEEHIRIFAEIHGYSNIEHAVQISIRNLQLHKYNHVKSSQLSGGNKRKLMTCLTLLGAPEVTILDEPSSGMDPAAQRYLWRTIQNVASHSSVILVSHSYPEIEALCDRVAIICEGKMRCIGTTHYLSAKFGKHLSVHVGIKRNLLKEQVFGHLLPLLYREYGGDEFVWVEDSRGDNVEIRVNKNAPGISVASLLETMIQSKVEFSSLGIEDPSLDDVFSDWVQLVQSN